MTEKVERLIASDERGIALVATMFMVLLLTILGSSMIFMSRTEALSSLNYKTMSQARYAAESGLHAAANHLIYSYTPPSSNATDAMAFYDRSKLPVRLASDGVTEVVMSSIPSVASHYPVQDVQDAFDLATHGTLSAGTGTARYTASARLLSMRVIMNSITASLNTLLTWEVTGRGTIGTAGTFGAATVEVSAIVETQERPVYGYAAFATDGGCGALDLKGNLETKSYQSSKYNTASGTAPTTDSTNGQILDSGGNVGTNGNLTITGSADVNGTLSTPRSGVGNCSGGSITAVTGSVSKVSEGVKQLPQSVAWPTPPAPSPMPPTSSDSFSQNTGCPMTLDSVAASACAPSTDGATFTPPTGVAISLGNVSFGNQSVVHLKAGHYIVNSLDMGANSTIIIDSGPVMIEVAGQSVTTPINMNGSTFSNSTYDPQNLQIIYGGTATLNINGGAASSALIYAPNATLNYNGNADFFGAMLAKSFVMNGNGTLYYDRDLDSKGLTIGNPTMSAFTWKSF